MLTTVAGNAASIGYVSVGSLNDSVKALEVDGVAPSVDTVADGSYSISRPFNLVTRDGEALSDASKSTAQGDRVLADLVASEAERVAEVDSGDLSAGREDGGGPVSTP